MDRIAHWPEHAAELTIRTTDPLADAEGPARLKNANVMARRRDAGWAPVRMHHRPTRERPRALAVDPGGGGW